MTEPLILAEALSKTYRVYSNPWDRLLEAATGKHRHREFHALRDVSFGLAAGEGLAVIGENGAGKSTLLKILAGITVPTTGRAEVRGQVASILELGSGFHPEFTGRQNIVLNAAMLGLSDREVRDKTPAIVEFSELGDFIDQPVKFYSTGMAMRLGFAIATQVEPDILIIDEALSVGDGYFQKKCMDRLVRFVEEGGTLLFCSHAMYYVAAFCRRALWLKGGGVEALGPSEAVIREYESYLVAKGGKSNPDGEDHPSSPRAPAATPGPARIETVRQLGMPAAGSFRHRQPWGVEIEWTAQSPDTAFHLAVGLDRIDDVQVTAFSSLHDALAPFTGSCRYTAQLWIPELPLLQGKFSIQVYLLDEAALHVYDQRKLRGQLVVESPSYMVGLVETAHRWERLETPAAPVSGAATVEERV